MSTSSGRAAPADVAFTHAQLATVEPIENEGIIWRPVRRRLGVTAFGINAYTAVRAGDDLIEAHDERSPGAGGHEELYFVVEGSARFTVADQQIDAPAGTMLRVSVGVQRAAVAAESDTTVLVIGGKPGAALPVSPFEYWYAAQGAVNDGDYRRAVAIASEGLQDWPEHGQLNYQLACYHALAGDRADALRHLRIAFVNDPRTRLWAAEDDDLVSVRDDPSLAP
jgi:mannose-6-phosphate isomerase-like protein (cupin superfamily)